MCSFGALYGCSSFLAGEFRDRRTVYGSYRTLLVCVWDGIFVKRHDSRERHWNSVQIVYIEWALILCVTNLGTSLIQEKRSLSGVYLVQA